MAYSSVTVEGFRGFADRQTLNLAIPNGSPGSGLTTLIGPNSGGKSTVLEAMIGLSQPAGQLPSFSEGKRNSRAGGRVHLKFETDEGAVRELNTVPSGGSSMSEITSVDQKILDKFFTIPSRRAFNPFFGKSSTTRQYYSRAYQKLENRRGGELAFSQRLFHVVENSTAKAIFDALLAKVIDPVPDWTIDLSDGGQHYLRINGDGIRHSSDGLGDGVVSAMFIVDALYDSTPGDIIIVDEPELSLHPAMQRKLLALLLEFSSDRQIVFSTHSPFLISWDAFVNGGELSRVAKIDDSSRIFRLSNGVRGKVDALRNDQNNPHILGPDAATVFFLDNRVILTEGQEDVLFIPKAVNSVGKSLIGEFFGWGVGGADKMTLVCHILSDLGFTKVVGLLDGDKVARRGQLEAEFPEYLFCCHLADDIRFKRSKPERSSLLAEGNINVRDEYRIHFSDMIDAANDYMNA